MTRIIKTLVVSATAFGAIAASTPAFATTLDVYKPCGCHPVQAQEVGVPSDSPAIDNPTGTVGNADNDNRVWTACPYCPRNSSALVIFTP